MGYTAYARGSKVVREQIETPPTAKSLPGSVNHPPAEPASKIPAPLGIGETVYCTVTALRGQPMLVSAVKGNQIKVEGYRHWCPASNFRREPT